MSIALTPMLRRLISDSNIHVGFRVFIAMAMTFVVPLSTLAPSLFSQPNSHLSISLCLGVMAYAIVENDDNHIGRQKFLFVVLTCFFITSSSVELLMPYPIYFGIGLLTSSFIFMMMGIFGSRYSKVGFGAILIAIYAMIGHQPGINWYEQPLLLTLGAFWYGIFSIIWNFYTPNRPLREQLAQLFFTLSRYQHDKSSLFNEIEIDSKQAILDIRQKLAIHNITIMARLQQSQSIIQSRSKFGKKQAELKELNQLYVIAEQIHERVIASQYLYSQLKNNFANSQILEGYRIILLELSDNFYQLGTSITDKKSYQNTRRLTWSITALADQLSLLKQKLQLVNKDHEDYEAMLALQAVYENIKGVHEQLTSISEKSELPIIVIDNEDISVKQSFWKKLLSSLSPQNTTFKHAVRISISLLLAFIIQQSLELEHGFWLLLTVLFVCQPSFSETRKRLIQRILGTLIGLLIGYPLLLLITDTPTQIFLMVTSAFFFFSYLRTNYALGIVFITLFVMFVFNLLAGEGINILPARIIETLLGGILSILTITFIFPDWQFQRFPSLVTNLLTLSNRYFNLVSAQYQYGRSENLNYRITRFQTFQAGAKLTSAWQSMLFEPTSKQKLNREVYALVNRCDALVCYISALASHRNKIEGFEENIALQELIDATAKQIARAYALGDLRDQQVGITIDEFENYKPALSGEALLVVEQLRLIAFTALDIQGLLQKVNFTHQNDLNQNESCYLTIESTK